MSRPLEVVLKALEVLLEVVIPRIGQRKMDRELARLVITLIAFLRSKGTLPESSPDVAEQALLDEIAAFAQVYSERVNRVYKDTPYHQSTRGRAALDRAERAKEEEADA